MRILLVTTFIALATYFAHGFVFSGVATADEGSSATSTKGESDVSDDAPQEGQSSRLNIAIKTAGGTQLWTDHIWREGCRVQQNALTGHWRLLDEDDVRRAWGTRAQCDTAMEKLKPKAKVSTKPRHVVVLLHGLMRTGHSLKPLESSLRSNGFTDVIRFSYASSRSSIGDHAASLRELLEDQPANTQFSFVGHSMGNIAVRHMIGDLMRDNDPKQLLPRFKSMVMLGPPNQGAAIARGLEPTGLYGIITGKGGIELGSEWDEFVKKLATPSFPFAIIAGDVSDSAIKNPLVGAGDFVVSLEEAKLDGSKAFHVVPVLHSFLMNDEKAKTLTVDFIKAH